MAYPLTYVYLACFAAMLIAATVVHMIKPVQPARWSNTAFLLLVGLWSLGDLLANLAATDRQIERVAQVFVFSWALVPYFALRIGLAYADKIRVLCSPLANAALLLPAGLCAYLVWSGQLFAHFTPAGMTAAYYHAHTTRWMPAVVIYVLGYIGTAGFVLSAVKREGSHSERRHIMSKVFWAVFAAAVVGALVNGGLIETGAHMPHIGSVLAAVVSGLVVIGVARRGFFAPLDDLRRAQSEVRLSQQRYQALVETSPDAITITDLDGRLLMINQRSAELCGYDSVQECLAVKNNELEFIVKEERDTARAVIAKALATGKQQNVEHRIVRKDGSILPVEVSVGLLRDADGQPIGFIGISRDISDRKRAEDERRNLEAQIQHAQKLESLGVLAGGIAHDFNNLLVGILGNAGLAKQELPGQGMAYERLRRIEAAAQHAATLTREMLAYSGRGKFVLEAINLSRLVGEITQLLHVSISKKIELVYDFAPDVPSVWADASQVQQVIMNLITNASEAIGHQAGRIVLRTSVVELQRDDLAKMGSPDVIEPGRYVCVEVEDNGCGMSSDTRARLFDPFFSTKFTGRGLGMAAVLGIVRGHRGAITADSEPGRGTTIRVYLPCMRDARTASARRLTPPPLSKEAWRGTGVVLVVDDEEIVRDVSCAALKQVGFDVMVARDGIEGLSLLTRHAADVVVVVLDLTMPRMDGREAFMHMRKLRAGLPVVFTSGYTVEEAAGDFDRDANTAFVQKPFSPIELVGAVRATLERNATTPG